MLKWLKLRNFQPHRKRTIVFDARITTIVGPTDSGKTAILRALRWVFFNRPQGVRFKTRGTKFTKASIGIDKHVVARKKGKKNSYKLDDGKELVAFKSDIPDPIKRILNVSDVNFQRQHDPVFWMSSTPGEVSKDLNRIVNLEVMDDALAEMASEVRKLTATCEVSQERLLSAEKERKKLLKAKQFHKEMRALAEQEARLYDLSEHDENLSSLIRSLKRSSSIIRKLPTFKGIDSLAEQAFALERKEEALAQAIDSIREQDAHIKTETIKLRKLEDQFHKTMKGRCPLCGQTMT